MQELRQILNIKVSLIPIRIEQNQARNFEWVLAGTFHLILMHLTYLCGEETRVLVGSRNRRFPSAKTQCLHST